MKKTLYGQLIKKKKTCCNSSFLMKKNISKFQTDLSLCQTSKVSVSLVNCQQPSVVMRCSPLICHWSLFVVITFSREMILSRVGCISVISVKILVIDLIFVIIGSILTKKIIKKSIIVANC